MSGMRQLIKIDDEREREMAEFMAIPSDKTNLENYTLLFASLTDAGDFKTVDLQYDEVHERFTLTVEYHNRQYIIYLGWYQYNFDDGCVTTRLSRKEHEALEKATVALKLSMLYNEDAQESIHLMMKVICTLMPNQIGVYNCNAYMVLSPLWVQHAAEALTPPPPSCLYTIHAVYVGNQYWLHTHGLNCCGFPELEIMDKMSKNEYSTLRSIYIRMIENAISSNELVNEKKAVYVGDMDNQKPIILTWIHWEEALKEYKKDVLGGESDRDDGHSRYSGIVFAYLSQKDYDKWKHARLTDLPMKRLINPLVFFTNRETERLSAMACERIVYLIHGLQMTDSAALVKVALPVDEEFKQNDGTGREHIWFKVDAITSESVTGTLIQEPYHVKDMHEGSSGTYPHEMITDWQLYVGDETITPDTSYILDQMVSDV
jgi:uncharacterized protein YegJ (DUF2314 family)